MARESGTASSGVTGEGRLYIENCFEPLIEGRNRSQTVTPKIQKVPNFLRDDSNFRRQYEPRMVSLGPIHHPNPKYQSGVGYDYKAILKIDFIFASGQQPNVLWNQIKKIIDQLRNCFEEEVTQDYDDNALASLLFKDGCAILQYIYCPPTCKMFDVIAQDILLLENQIPYEVLKELMRLSKNKDKLEKSIVHFIVTHANLPFQANPQRDVQIDGDHVHLLDLLRTSLLGKSHAKTINKRRYLPNFVNRNVRQLKATGIHLRRSSNCFLSNISFRRRFHLLGRLYLPPISVDYSARLKFLNLVAYERCLDFKNDPGPGVISYLRFLNSLINEAQDVKELRDAGVLYNSFGSDRELQTLFSEICAGLVFGPDAYAYDYAYIEVKEKIEEYHGTLMSKMLQFYHANIEDNSLLLTMFLVVFFSFLVITQIWLWRKT